MSLSKCALFLTFCLYFCQCVASSWTVDMPASAKVLEGSCVVIPCSFDYPPPGQEAPQFTGIWTDESGHVIYHPDKTKAMTQYRNRTNLLGDLLHKNCSLKIDPVQASDKGPYHFRIEIENFEKYSYKEKTVSITTTMDLEPVGFSVKEEVLLDDSVSAKCSVSHSCPPSPPHISWSHSGNVQVQHRKIGGALWTTTSTITFHPRRTDHNGELQCTVTHSGGRNQSAGKVLSVKYAPEIRNASSCYYEGHHVRCMCIAESNPPSDVQLLLSDRALTTTTEQYGLLTVVTLQMDVGFFSSIKCTANNIVGKADIVLSLPLSNVYIYIGAGLGAAALILIILLIVVVARKCSGKRRENTLTSHKHDIALDTPQYAASMHCPTNRKRSVDAMHCPTNRKRSVDAHYSKSFMSDDHTYGNTETFDPDDDAVYANV